MPDRDHHREIPRRDRADDADGLAMQLDPASIVVLKHFDRQRQTGGVTRPCGRPAQLPPGAEAVQGLALFQRQKPRKLFGVRLQHRGNGAAGLGALLVRQRRPARLCGARGRDRPVQIGSGGIRRLARDLARGGVQDGESRLGHHLLPEIGSALSGGPHGGQQHLAVADMVHQDQRQPRPEAQAFLIAQSVMQTHQRALASRRPRQASALRYFWKLLRSFISLGGITAWQ